MLIKPKRVRIKGLKTNAPQRTLAHLRKLGYQAAVCEKYISRVAGKNQIQKFHGGFRQDLFGFIDVIAFHSELTEVLAIQTTTTRAQIANHLRKYRDIEKLEGKDREKAIKTQQAIRDWLAHPYRKFIIHGWEPIERQTKKGTTATKWELTEREITIGDLDNVS